MPSTAAGVASSAAYTASAVIGAAAAGAVGGAIITGTVKGAFYGALTGAAVGAIGSTTWSNTTKSLANGTASGVTTELQGGKFGHGFISAGVGFWTGLKFGGAPNFGGFMGSTIAGGTISAITGGKFANGAITSSLSYLSVTAAKRSNLLAKQRTSGLVGDQVRSDETPQERVDRLALLVYGDFPSLPEANIMAVEELSGDTEGYIGQYLGGRDVEVLTINTSDQSLRSTIFHELLHVDEALATSGGILWLYRAHERSAHFFRHDPWIDRADFQYFRFLNDMGQKPTVELAPWRPWTPQL